MWSEHSLETREGPLWARVAGIFRDAIDVGEFPSGASLPTEAEINAHFGISRTTSRSAMQQLVTEGLISRVAGHGTTVIDRKIETERQKIRGFSEDMKARGLTASYDVISAEFSCAPPEASQALSIPAGDAPFHLKRLLRANGRIIGMSDSYLRSDIFSGVAPPSDELLGTGSLYDWIADNTGIRITGGVEYIEAGLAASELSRILELDPGEPVLIARRTAFSASRLPIEFAEITYRADRYRFRIEL